MKIGPISFMKQGMMRKVFYALVPILLVAIYNFGLRVIGLLAVTTFFAVCTEWIFKRKAKKPVSEAVFITSFLFVLTLPPRTPYWIAAVGIIFGIVFGKEAFGGFGRNVFNPALVARAFVYISFPHFLTVEWTRPIPNSLLGGFSRYIGPSIDAISSATPMLAFRSTGFVTNFKDLILGNVSGSLGETSALLILLSGVYLLYTKTAKMETPIATIIGFFITSYVFNFLGVTKVPPPIFGLVSGGILFAAVFMVTDPISAPKTVEGRWLYGFLIGSITVIIRGFALFAGGVMFAILIGNSFAPLIDEGVKSYKKWKSEKQTSKGVKS